MKYVKRAVWSLLLGALLIAHTGCSPSGSGTANTVNTGTVDASSDTVSKITGKGEMHIGYLVFDPCVIKDPKTGKLSGFFIDAIEYICGELKVKPVYHETTLKDFSAGLQSGQYDVSIGPTFRTVGRAASVTFTDPVAYIGNSGLALRTQAGRFRTLADLNNPNVRIAVLQGQAMEAFCRTNVPRAKLVVLAGDQGLVAPLAAVSARRADVGMSNSVTVYKYAAEHPEVADLFAKNPLEVVGLSWSVRPSDQRLLSLLNNSIGYLRDTERIRQWQLKYPTPLYEVVKTLRPVQKTAAR